MKCVILEQDIIQNYILPYTTVSSQSSCDVTDSCHTVKGTSTVCKKNVRDFIEKKMASRSIQL